MTITFSSALAKSRDYPPPRFSMTPHEVGSQALGDRPNVKNVAQTAKLSLARNALAFIAHSQLSPGSTILLPAYHCPSLVEPFIWAGCRVEFYPLNADLTPDLSGLTAASEQLAACVLVRYFGFESATEQAAEQLRAAGYLVIEDLAHAAHANVLHGDYGVTSLRKFYPVATGAEIFIGSSVTDPSSIKAEADRWPDSALQWKLNKLRGKLAARFSKNRSHKYTYINERYLRQPVSRIDCKEISRHNHQQLAQQRRANFHTLAQLLADVSIGAPLHRELALGEVPYVFPFLLKDSSTFRELRKAGIPLYRWEELAASDCKISKHYRGHLIQFPCHQDLKSEDLDYIANVCESVSGHA